MALSAQIGYIIPLKLQLCWKAYEELYQKLWKYASLSEEWSYKSHLISYEASSVCVTLVMHLAAVTFCQACRYCPTLGATLPFGQYQIIWLDERWTSLLYSVNMWERNNYNYFANKPHLCAVLCKTVQLKLQLLNKQSPDSINCTMVPRCISQAIIVLNDKL